jgi:hypothetical protein
VDLPALLTQVFLELEKSIDPERRALLQRLREGTQTERDASDVADMIEALVEHAANSRRNN